MAKPPEQRGRFLHPELYGMPESFNIYAEKLAALNALAAPRVEPAHAAKLNQPAPQAPAVTPMKGGK